jgi:hypothetical protein
MDDKFPELGSLDTPPADLYPVTVYQPQELESISRALSASKGNEPLQEKFLQSIANEIAVDNEDDTNYSTFEGLIDGSATVYQHPGLFPGLEPRQIKRILSGLSEDAGDEDFNRNNAVENVIRLFARDNKNEPLFRGNEKLGEALTRGLVKGAGNAATFLAAAKATNAGLQAFPLTAVPVTPLQAGIRIFGPPAVGLGAVVLGSGATDDLADTVAGRESLLIPGSDFYYNVVEKIGEDGPFVFAPLGAGARGLGAKALMERTVPREFSKGLLGRDPGLLKGLEAFKRQTYFVDPPLKMMNYQFKRAQRGKRPVLSTRSLRATAGAEQIIERMRRELKNPVVLSSEAGALTVGALASEAAKDEGASFGMQVVAELGGNVLGGVLLDTFSRRLVPLAAKLAELNRIRKDMGGIKPALKETFRGRQAQNEQRVANFVWDFLSRYGDDPNQILKDIESGKLDEAVNAYERANPGSSINVSTAMKTSSPAMLALQKAVADSIGGAGGSFRENSVKMADGVRLYLRAMYATGDPTAVSTAAEAARDIFETSIQNNIDRTAAQVTAAFLRVAGKNSVDELSDIQMSDLGNDIFKAVSEAKAKVDAGRRRLYANVPENLVVREFKNPEGEPVDVPNVVSVWDEVKNPDLEFSNRNLVQELRTLIDYSKDRAQKMGLDFDVGDDLNPDVSTFRKIYDDYRGTDTQTQFDYYVSKLGKKYNLDDPSPASLTELSSLIRDINRRNPEGGEDLSALLTAKRDELVSLRRSADKKADTEPFEGITHNSLDKIRSTALDLAANTKDAATRKAANDFAAAALADMNSLPPGSNFELDMARRYTAAANDAFERTFAGEVLESSRAKGLKIDPENDLGKRIFSAGSVRSRNLADIGKFSATQYLTTMFTGVPGRGQELAADFIEASTNPKSKVLDLVEARKWLDENKNELEALPGYVFREVKKGKDTYLEAVTGGTLYENLADTLEDSTTLRGSLENVLRQIRVEAVAVSAGDPDSIQGLSPKAIRDWLAKDSNREILAAYPKLKDDLEKFADGNESVLSLFIKNKKRREDELKARKQGFSFYQLLPEKNESPVKVISDAIKSQSNPLGKLDEAWQVVDKAPKSWVNKINGEIYRKDDAVEGFKSTVLDAVLLNAGSTEKDFNALNAYRTLFAPMQYAKGRKSLADWLVDKNIYSADEVKNVEEFMSRAAELQNAIFAGNPGDVDELINKMGAGAELIVSVLGATSATRLQRMVTDDTSASLIIASRGAQSFRNAYSKLVSDAPSVLKMDILKKALEEPDFMAKLLRQGKTEQEKNRVMGSIARTLVLDGYLLPAARRGVLYPVAGAAGESEIDLNLGSEAAAAEMPPERPPARTPARSVRPVEPITAPAGPYRPQALAPRPAAPAPMTGAANPEQRARMQQLFPGDTMMTGIGSL